MLEVNLDIKNGEIRVEDVPIPQLRENGILVRTAYSLISAGTEKATLELAKSSLIEKSKKRPDLTKKVMESMRKNGVIPTVRAVLNRLSMPEKLGYSCSGIVLKVGKNVTNVKVGDRVACAGVGFANHAEVNYVPKNLFVPVPDNVSLKDAAYVAIGAIAVQGVRNSKISFGENVAVIGLGLLGLITVQILRAAGCRVMGFDINEKKLTLAKRLGANMTANINDLNITMLADNFTGGYGFDAVIITASTSSSQPIHVASNICRDKGRIVVVGNVGLQLKRPKFYEKELELIVSRSYGPGRYDKTYEENGVDYPYGYVRWTENRNMEAFLKLLSEKRVNLKEITTHIFPIERAREAYDLINDKTKEDYIGILFKYKGAEKEKELLNDDVKILNYEQSQSSKNVVAVIGAGSFAVTTFLPFLRKNKDIMLKYIASQTGTSAKAVAKKYKFNLATSNVDRIFSDPAVNKVFILTRNSTHAEYAIKSLKNGKDVFVEKPPAVFLKEFIQLKKVVKKYNRQLFYVDFNRRYSSLTKITREYLKKRTTPIIATYRVNGDILPYNHWVYDIAEGGSRYISELCHFVDYLFFITDSSIKDVWFNTIKVVNKKVHPMENLIFNIEFKDGSIGNIIYNTLGDPSHNKEYVELMFDKTTIINKDFRLLEIYNNGKRRKKKIYFGSEKGHRNIIEEFLNGRKPEKDMLYAYEYILKAKEEE